MMRIIALAFFALGLAGNAAVAAGLEVFAGYVARPSIQVGDQVAPEMPPRIGEADDEPQEYWLDKVPDEDWYNRVTPPIRPA